MHIVKIKHGGISIGGLGDEKEESARNLIDHNVEEDDNSYRKSSGMMRKNEKNIISNISNRLKATFWNYYKDHKTDMIEEQSFTGSYFKDEHDFQNSGSSDEADSVANMGD